MSYSTAIASHDLILYVNGAMFGIVTSMQWNVGAEWRPVQVIDYGGPIEFLPGSTRVQGNFGVVRARYNSSMEGLGLTTYARNLLRQKYLHLQVQDRSTGNVLYEATNVVVTSQTWQATPKQLVQGSFSWEGMGFTNSDDPDGQA